MSDTWPVIRSLLNASRSERVSILRLQADESAMCKLAHGTHGQQGRNEMAEANDVTTSLDGHTDALEVLRESNAARVGTLMDYFRRSQFHNQLLERQTDAAINFRFHLERLEELKGSGLIVQGTLMQAWKASRTRTEDAAKHKAQTLGQTTSVQQPMPQVIDDEDLMYACVQYNCQGDAIFSLCNSGFSFDADAELTLPPALRVLLPLSTSLLASRAVWRMHCRLPIESAEKPEDKDTRKLWHLEVPSAGYGIHPFIMRWPRNRSEMLSAIQTLLPPYQSQWDDEDAQSDMSRRLVPESTRLVDMTKKPDIEANRCGFVTLHQLKERSSWLDAQESTEPQNSASSRIPPADSSSSSTTSSSSSTHVFDTPPSSSDSCSCLNSGIECTSDHSPACDPECGQCKDRDPHPEGPTFCLDHLQLLRGCMWWRCARSIHLIRQLIFRELKLTESFEEGLYDGVNYSGEMDWRRVFAVATLPTRPSSNPSSNDDASTSASLTQPGVPSSSSAPSTSEPEPEPHLAALPSALASSLRESLPWALDVVFGARGAIRPVPVLVVAPLSDGWIGGFMGTGDFVAQ